MLQRVNVETSEPVSASTSNWLKPSYYWKLLSRRWPYIFFPFLLISIVGVMAAKFLPPVFFSEGKILVQPPQIANDLVRPATTSSAQDRLQVINQRTMTRDNLLATIDRFDLFPRQRATYTPSELVELMRRSIHIMPLEPTLEFSQRVRSENPAIVVAVGFEYPDADVSKDVADDLINRIVTEDARDRTSRAVDTTAFLRDEVAKLQRENDDLSVSIAKARVMNGRAGRGTDSPDSLLAQLREEYVQKGATYSDNHPAQRALRAQIASLEAARARQKSGGAPPEESQSLDALISRQDVVRKNLEQSSARLSAAQAGESLERNKQAEKLEVIETPTVPQKPLRPNRLKIILASLQAGLAFGIALALFVDAVDGRVRSSADLSKFIDPQLLVSVPYIFVGAEPRVGGRRIFIGVVLLGMIAVSIAAVASTTSKGVETVISDAWTRVFR